MITLTTLLTIIIILKINTWLDNTEKLELKEDIKEKWIIRKNLIDNLADYIIRNIIKEIVKKKWKQYLKHNQLLDIIKTYLIGQLIVLYLKE